MPSQPQAQTERKPVRTPNEGALFRRVIFVQGKTRTVRIGVYPKKANQKTGIIFGLGKDKPDTYAKINFEVTEEDWYEIDKAVKEAFRVATGGVPKTARQRTRKKRDERKAAIQAEIDAEDDATATPPNGPQDPPAGTSGVAADGGVPSVADASTARLTGSRKRQPAPPPPGLFQNTQS